LLGPETRRERAQARDDEDARLPRQCERPRAREQRRARFTWGRGHRHADSNRGHHDFRWRKWLCLPHRGPCKYLATRRMTVGRVLRSARAFYG
jgi:hypothetical protein